MKTLVAFQKRLNNNCLGGGIMTARHDNKGSYQIDDPSEYNKEDGYDFVDDTEDNDTNRQSNASHEPNIEDVLAKDDVKESLQEQ
jgi:hypothetical protein